MIAGFIFSDEEAGPERSGLSYPSLSLTFSQLFCVSGQQSRLWGPPPIPFFQLLSCPSGCWLLRPSPHGAIHVPQPCNLHQSVSGPHLLLAVFPFSLCSEGTVSAPTNIILSKSSNKVLVQIQCY